MITSRRMPKMRRFHPVSNGSQARRTTDGGFCTFRFLRCVPLWLRAESGDSEQAFRRFLVRLIGVSHDRGRPLSSGDGGRHPF